MLRSSLLFALLLPLTAAAEPAAKYAEAIKSLETMIERERQDAGIPGLSIAVVEDQTVLWSKGFGHANLAKTKAASTDTVYRVGSVSKLFTDIAVMQLVEEGKLDLDAPVTKYLPEFKPTNSFGKDITLRQLMSHRSGLVREPPVGNYFDADPPSLEKTVASLNGIPLVYEPGTKIKYSNAAIAVVGRVVERVDGRPFAKAVRERVLVPLGMTHSDFEPTAAVKAQLSEAQMWTYHGRDFPAPTFELGEGPAGCMYSTVTDLARFASTLFADGKPVLKAESLQKMLTPQFAKPDAKDGFGLGFMLGELDGQKRIGHGGAIYGFSTELAILPESKLGVIVIANKDVANRVTTRIADVALRTLLAAKADKPLPTFAESGRLPRELARRFAGKYGDEWPHKLIEAGGKLFYLPPNGGFLAEVRNLGADLVLSGILGNGKHLKCDGTMLSIDGKSHKRVPIPTASPGDPPPHIMNLIGEYGTDHNILFIFEKDAKLHALIEWFYLYPLEAEAENVYRFPTDGGLYHGEKLVFKRDANGKGIEINAAQVVFKRRQLDGEDGRTFRIKPLRPVEEIRKEAMVAKPPLETGEYRKADLVELTSLDSTIKTDLRYASDNNFLGTPLYPPTAKAYMQRPAAEALVRVNRAIKKDGFGLLVHDPYRPWYVTKTFWEATPEKMRMFVADPSKGSRHNRGCAVDLTLYELKTGKPVMMVSGYDEFSDRAYPNYWGGTSRQRWLREYLRHAMEDEGFTVYEAEWWHFDFKDWKSYRIGNQSFEELAR
ncbi:MAG TPA: serine hydrolase [Gemmataceae bacterium]|jgi:serine beta-lactamase-like protein LACTB|nr:serine hydrolase [Gemmataceae bacterium]